MLYKYEFFMFINSNERTFWIYNDEDTNKVDDNVKEINGLFRCVFTPKFQHKEKIE